MAWRESDADETIVALDDDCDVEDPTFAEEVERRFLGSPARALTGAGQHLNIFDVFDGVDSRRVFPRGFPYSARIGYVPWHVGDVAPFDDAGDVVFNLGLWKDAFDVNAVDKIQGAQWLYPDPVLRAPSVVIPRGVLASLCSMNMHFRRSVIPAIYQLPMNVEIMPGWTIDRFGDIWGGFILETLAGIRGDRLLLGGPLIRHRKEGGFERNIRQEHLAHTVNDEFIRLLLEIRARLTRGSYLDMVAELREELCEASGEASPILQAYLRHLVAALELWVRALRQS